jgi:hypothetical protein
VRLGSRSAANDAANFALSRSRNPLCGGEIDCDRFLEYLAPLLDGRIDDPELREKLAHHVRQCGECHEEFEIVKRWLES